MKKLLLTLILTTLLPASTLALQKAVPESREQVVLSYAPIVKKAAPAVVNIYTRKKLR